MHVVIFGDQHVESSGGAQVSTRLQRRFLERAGHTVTIVAPRMHARRSAGSVDVPDPAYVDLPSIPITLDREYSLTWPGRRTDAVVDRALAARGRIDVVHVQADFWGAFVGHRFAARHALPVVHTMHNRVDVGIAATMPAAGLVLRALNGWARAALRPAVLDRRRTIARASDDSPRIVRRRRDAPTAAGGRSTVDGWALLRRFGMLSDAVTAPSTHFARRLERHGVFAPVEVVWNGIDDDVLDAALEHGRAERRPGLPRFVWVGRMSPEKRLLPFLEAVARSRIDAEVSVIGGGAQRAAAERLVGRLAPRARVEFAGRLPYAQTLSRVRDADAVVQTSIGFETQGMTVFEAAALGTPSVVSDPDIAAELGASWGVADASVSALAETLSRACADIRRDTAPVPEPRMAELFRQSSRTAAMVEVYQRAVARRSS